ncbi:BAH_G0017370.mRNA.1.CDS.1 [Saccharomyces cerevisiae]|nr:BAH_G0017370.mRNA.1.CDS.1 [Saccharomyces cerevisiae]CAI7116035.1 BAH_G0017370.mRNA.1.CDS.1 [Saccharomyces cerevisiae]
MKLIHVLGEEVYRDLMKWEDEYETCGIAYEYTSDGNPYGLLAKAVDESDVVIAERTVYGKYPIRPWLEAFGAQLDDWANQLKAQVTHILYDPEATRQNEKGTTHFMERQKAAKPHISKFSIAYWTYPISFNTIHPFQNSDAKGNFCFGFIVFRKCSTNTVIDQNEL